MNVINPSFFFFAGGDQIGVCEGYLDFFIFFFDLLFSTPGCGGGEGGGGDRLEGVGDGEAGCGRIKKVRCWISGSATVSSSSPSL